MEIASLLDTDGRVNDCELVHSKDVAEASLANRNSKKVPVDSYLHMFNVIITALSPSKPADIVANLPSSDQNASNLTNGRPAKLSCRGISTPRHRIKKSSNAKVSIR